MNENLMTKKELIKVLKILILIIETMTYKFLGVFSKWNHDKLIYFIMEYIRIEKLANKDISDIIFSDENENLENFDLDEFISILHEYEKELIGKKEV